MTLPGIGLLEVVGLLLSLAVTAGAAVHLLTRRREPAATTAWLLSFLVLPIAGPLFYALVGVDRIARRAVVKEGRNRSLRLELRHLGEGVVELSSRTQARSSAPEPLPESLGAFREALEGLCRHAGLDGHEIAVLAGGEATFGAMHAAIAEAKRSIRLQSYIFEDDAVGRTILDRLSEAAGRGVRVQLLYDAVGSLHTADRIFDQARAAGVEVSVYAPRHWSRGRYQFNLRNHRKLLVVDGEVAFLGGHNITATHLPADVHGGTGEVVDLHVRVRGPAVFGLATVFAEDWYDATGRRLLDRRDYPVLEAEGPNWCRVVPSGPDGDAERHLRLLLAAIHAARDRVLLASPYFLPDAALSEALRIAAIRGVRVEVLVSQTLDHPYAGWALGGLVDPLLESGVVVLPRPGPLMHAKIAVVDGAWALVGSSNLDPRSFRLNYELNLSIVGPAVAEIEAAYDTLARGVEPMDLRARRLRPSWVRAWERLWSLWSPLL